MPPKLLTPAAGKSAPSAQKNTLLSFFSNKIQPKPFETANIGPAVITPQVKDALTDSNIHSSSINKDLTFAAQKEDSLNTETAGETLDTVSKLDSKTSKSSPQNDTFNAAVVTEEKIDIQEKGKQISQSFSPPTSSLNDQVPDDNIERLVFSPARTAYQPMAPSSAAVTEISSFYISPVSLTNNSYLDFSNQNSNLFATFLPSLMDVCDQSVIPDRDLTTPASIAFTESSVHVPEEIGLDIEVNESAENISGVPTVDYDPFDEVEGSLNAPQEDVPDKASRKRKPTERFDPTPKAGKPKKTQSKATSKTLAKSIDVDTPRDSMDVDNAPNNLEDAPISSPAQKSPTANADDPIVTEENKKSKSSKSRSSVKATNNQSPSALPETVKEVVPLPIEVQTRINRLQDRIAEWVSELSQFEKLAEYDDKSLDLSNLEEEILRFVAKPVGVNFLSEIIEPRVASASDPAEDTKEKDSNEQSLPTICCGYIRSIISRVMQGENCTMTGLIDLVISKLSVLINHLQQISSAEEEEADASSERLKVRDALLAELAKLGDTLSLSEEIKSLGERKCYGNRQKTSSLFEDSDPAAIWRWEVHSFQFFKKTSQATIREARALRGRYSRAVKGYFKLIEQLQKDHSDAAKLAPLEEGTTKSMTEIEKFKEKRRELEQKRAQDAEEKAKREELKEKKRKEKEEADLLKKQQQEEIANARQQAIAEKEKKKKEEQDKLNSKLEKQQSFFKSFVKPVAKPSQASNSPSSSKPAAGTINLCDEEDKYNNFVSSLNSTLSLEELLKVNISRRSNAGRQKRPRFSKRSRTIKLSVTISTPNPNAFSASDATYSEVVERTVRNRISTFSFCEDNRPAYVGTVSRKSRVIRGRNPLARDNNLLNYDYDSEEEWEEEGEGEDIAESDEEEDEGGNELEYDDFFRRDNDFGSDVDSDAGDIAPILNPSRIKVECHGPRFIANTAITPFLAEERFKYLDRTTAVGYKYSAEMNLVACGHGDEDTMRLSAYTAAVFYYPNLELALGNKRIQNTGKAKDDDDAAPAAPKVMKGFDESKLPDLIKLIHGSKDGSEKLVNSFAEANPLISKVQIKKRILEIADKKKHAEGHGTVRWIVKEEFLKTASPEIQQDILFTPPKKKKRISVESINPTAISAATNLLASPVYSSTESAPACSTILESPAV